MGKFDVAQVCLNGHPTNSTMIESPEFNKSFCPVCGAKTINACSACNHAIQGEYKVEGVVDLSYVYDPTAFCQSCGEPFPWTSRRIKAAIDLAESELEEADKEVFEQNVGELVTDSPQTKVAAARIKKILTKVGTTFGESIRDILVDVASETAKKIIWGQYRYTICYECSRRLILRPQDL
ncbi:DUF2321 domain-containing protein [Ferroacidibacillus organovorans]|uniref:DUF2321 domain-containing protein n=1 Tax=Ferroacidibacillus organovorans TaxID=1765683 RepID=A0A853K7F8_9BACL|nr:DUF2321 domain-containing protein [Ferroacidibacillus organovorans]KYP79598.1 hypothetical protein AYJ22_14135 [Ferroacidibacillus organovorans]OAG91649.1 hypothetical protein AYW79_13685 [Ferroacidibacillus organovorans]